MLPDRFTSARNDDNVVDADFAALYHLRIDTS
jgi:hypothetical protein